MATSFQIPRVQPLHSLQQRSVRERNETAYTVTCSYLGLPEAHVAWEATESSVLVSATQMDVLAGWLYVQGGTVSVVDLPSGQSVWTLATSTWSDSEALPRVPVFVSVVVPSDVPVVHEVRAAVAS
jgi:hypothetical protein